MYKSILSAIVIAFFLFIAFGSGDNNSSTSSSVSSDTGSNDKVEQSKIGDQITVGNFAYMVNGMKYYKSLGSEYSRKRADGIFLVVGVVLKNLDKEEHTLDNSMFKLTDESGTEYESSIDGNTALEMAGRETLFLKQCNPNIQKQGVLCFEVPDKGNYSLHLSGGMLSGETAIVKLSK